MNPNALTKEVEELRAMFGEADGSEVRAKVEALLAKYGPPHGSSFLNEHGAILADDVLWKAAMEHGPKQLRSPLFLRFVGLFASLDYGLVGDLFEDNGGVPEIMQALVTQFDHELIREAITVLATAGRGSARTRQALGTSEYLISINILLGGGEYPEAVVIVALRLLAAVLSESVEAKAIFYTDVGLVNASQQLELAVSWGAGGGGILNPALTFARAITGSYAPICDSQMQRFFRAVLAATHLEVDNLYEFRNGLCALDPILASAPAALKGFQQFVAWGSESFAKCLTPLPGHVYCLDQWKFDFVNKGGLLLVDAALTRYAKDGEALLGSALRIVAHLATLPAIALQLCQSLTTLENIIGIIRDDRENQETGLRIRKAGFKALARLIKVPANVASMLNSESTAELVYHIQDESDEKIRGYGVKIYFAILKLVRDVKNGHKRFDGPTTASFAKKVAEFVAGNAEWAETFKTITALRVEIAAKKQQQKALFMVDTDSDEPEVAEVEGDEGGGASEPISGDPDADSDKILAKSEEKDDTVAGNRPGERKQEQDEELAWEAATPPIDGERYGQVCWVQVEGKLRLAVNSPDFETFVGHLYTQIAALCKDLLCSPQGEPLTSQEWIKIVEVKPGKWDDYIPLTKLHEGSATNHPIPPKLSIRRAPPLPP